MRDTSLAFSHEVGVDVWRGGMRMKKYVLVAAIAFAGWNYFQNKQAEQLPTGDEQVEPAALLSESKSVSEEQSPAFQCDGRVYCSDMHSRAEAEFFVKHCAGTKMDGDNDGEPCESDSRF